MMRTIVILLISCFIIDSCKTAKDKNAGTQNYSTIEIYCFCFQSKISSEKKNGKDIAVLCSTPFRFTPKVLVTPEHLLYKSRDSITIDSITKALFTNKKVEKISPEPESRFVILLKKDLQSSDTLVYINNKKLYHNNGESFEYSFNILDSIKKAIKMEKINCD